MPMGERPACGKAVSRSNPSVHGQCGGCAQLHGPEPRTWKYPEGNLFTVILTGMGYDGLKGAKYAIEAGAALIAQDQASSIVWGMPGAVAQAGLCNAVLPLAQIGQAIGRVARGEML